MDINILPASACMTGDLAGCTFIITIQIMNMVLNFLTHNGTIDASQRDIMNLQIPNDVSPDKTYASLVLFSTPDFRNALHNAWYDAKLARENAQPIPTLGLGITIINYGQHHFTDAFRSSIIVDGHLTSLIAEDIKDMDNMGADRLYSTEAHVAYLKAKEMISVLQEQFTPNTNSSLHKYDFCNDLNHNVSKIRCLSQKLSNYQNARYITGPDATDLYNAIVSPTAGAIKYLSDMHVADLSAMAKFKDLYDGKISYYSSELDSADNMIRDLKGIGIELVTPDIEAQIPIQTSSIISKPLSVLYSEIVKSVGGLDTTVKRASGIYSGKGDDYLYNALSMMDNATARLAGYKTDLELLRAELKDLQVSGNSIANKLLQENKSTRLLYIEANSLYEKAQSERNVGKKLEYLSQAITYLKDIRSGKDIYDFSRIDSLLNSFSSISCDVSDDIAEAKKLKELNKPSFYDDNVLQANKIVDDAKYRCGNILKAIDNLGEKASSYLDANTLLGSEGLGIDAKQYGYDLEAAKTKDKYLNLKSIKDTYINIIDGMETKVKKAALVYLNKTTNTKCAENGIFYEVTNPFRFQLTDIQLQKNGTTISLAKLDAGEPSSGTIPSQLCSVPEVSYDYVNYTQSLNEKQKIVNSICDFTDCSDARKTITNLTKDIQANRTLDFTSLNAKIEDMSYSILSRFDYENISQRLENINSLKHKLSQVLSTDVGFDISDYTPPYSQKKFDQRVSDINKLSKITDFFGSISFSSKSSSDRLKELISQFSKKDLLDMDSNIAAVQDQLKNDLDSTKQTVADKVKRTAEEYKTSGNDGMNEYLNLALSSYNGGEYNKASLYADKAHSLASQGSSFPMEYLIVGGVISIASLYILKKPGLTKKEQKKRIRDFNSED